jgi:hypothetical protein
MRQSKKIALSGISAALGSILLILARIAPTGKLSLFALSSLALALPLSKKIYGYAALTVLATAAIAFLFGGVTYFVPYILGFGPHPIVNALLEKYSGRRAFIIKTAAKTAYFVALLYLLYALAYVAQLFSVEIEFYILALIAAPVFAVYDYLLTALMKKTAFLVNRYID